MNDQIILVISSPSSSTTGFCTLILAMGGDAIARQRFQPSRMAALADGAISLADGGGLGWGDLCLTVVLMAGTVSQPTRADAPWQTHTVTNQPPPLEGVDVFSSNLPLVEATAREGAGWIRERAAALGRFVGGEPQQLWGWQANEHK